VNVKIYGTFQFESLERSQLAGAFHLMDLLTFRELYGFATAEQQAEMDKLDAAINVKEVAAADAEEALFGGDAEVVVAGDGSGFDEFAGVDLAGRRAAALAAAKKPYTAEELDRGMVLNMAVFLKDPSRLQQTKAAIETLSAERGLKLQAIDWHAASGLVGDFTSVIYLVLIVMVSLIFIVASIIIINSMIMATLERVKEIGTMRAIGGQRSFVLAMVMVEALTLCMLFGIIGTAAGGGIVLALQSYGIPAFDQILFFLFGGPALHPPLELVHVGIALAVVVAVSLLSSIAPAMIATRIEPVVAMQTKE
jgi:ABC-type antimicrobial peptide transport system permease subunit